MAVSTSTTTTMVEYGDDFWFDWTIKGSLNDLKILTGGGRWISSENLKSPGTQNIWQMAIGDAIVPSIYSNNSKTKSEPFTLNSKLIKYGHPSLGKKTYGYRCDMSLTYENTSISAGATQHSYNFHRAYSIAFKWPEMILPIYSLSNVNFEVMKNVRIKGRIQSEPQIIIENEFGKKVREIQKTYGLNKNFDSKEGQVLSKILEGYPEDILVVCKEEVFTIHKYLLTAQSQVFARMLEVNMSEKQNNRIVIEDFEPEIVQIFLDFLKNISKQVGIEKELEKIGWEKTKELFKMSHKYQIDDLKTECEALLWQKIGLENVFEMFEVGKLYDSCNLKESALQFIRSKKRSPEIVEAFKENPELLSEIQSEVWKNH